MSDPQEPKPPRRRPAGNRAHPHRTTLRWSNEDYARLLEKATQSRLSVGGYIRSCVPLDAPTTRAQRRPSMDEVKLAPLLKAVNRMGGNLHQVARYRNFGGMPVDEEIHAALVGYDAMVAAVLEAMGRRL